MGVYFQVLLTIGSFPKKLNENSMKRSSRHQSLILDHRACCDCCADRLSRQVQGKGWLEPIEERVIPIQRRQQQPHHLQQQQQRDTTTDSSRHYAVYRRRASNIEPSLSSSLPSPSATTHSLIVGADDLSGGFCVSVGRHARGFSLSLRPQQQQQQQQQQQRSSPITDRQRPLVSVVIPAIDASLRQPSPSNSISSMHDNVQVNNCKWL